MGTYAAQVAQSGYGQARAAACRIMGATSHMHVTGQRCNCNARSERRIERVIRLSGTHAESVRRTGLIKLARPELSSLEDRTCVCRRSNQGPCRIDEFGFGSVLVSSSTIQYERVHHMFMGLAHRERERVQIVNYQQQKNNRQT
jgi:hypothetical protein